MANKLPARRKKGTSQGLVRNEQEDEMASMIDELAAFNEFQQLAPRLRAALLKHETAPEIYKEFQTLVAARTLNIALTETDSGKALAAIKEVLDRAIGKATENKVVRHHLEDVDDNSLDAILISEISELAEEEGED